MKSAKIFMYDRYAGILTENEDGFSFVYDPEYLQQTDAEPISLPCLCARSLTKTKCSFLFSTD